MGPQFVWIEGEAGIGNTRLAEDLLMLAEHEAQPVGAGSHALAGGLAYGPIADWLPTEALRAGLAELDAVWLTGWRGSCPSSSASARPASAGTDHRWLAKQAVLRSAGARSL